MKTLSIVIPVFNKFNFTKSCLKDLSQLPSDHEVIIVDNASSDETQSSLEGSTEIVYQRNETNLGFAKACNLGYALATSSNVLFLNNDIRVKSDHSTWTNNLLKWCSQAIVGPTMGQLDDNLSFKQEANRLLAGKSYISGWCMASSKEIWDKLEIPRTEPFPNAPVPHVPQILSEEFGLAYFEDTDLSFRAKQLKIDLVVADVPVVHFGKQTSKQLNTYQLYSQARQIFIKKWKR